MSAFKCGWPMNALGGLCRDRASVRMRRNSQGPWMFLCPEHVFEADADEARRGGRMEREAV